MPVEKIPKVKASALVVKQIEKMIEEGTFTAGDKLPSVRELCELFDVGRSTIRDAIITLNGKGIVYVKQGEGTFVNEFDSSRFFNHPLLSPNEKNIRELFQVRKILEAGIAKEAALNATKKDLVRIDSSLLGEGDEWENDYNFHMEIAKSSKNPILVQFMEFISGILKKTMMEFHKQIHDDQSTVQMIDTQHRIVYEAIKAGLPDEAYRAMFNHLTSVEKLLKEHILEEEM